MDCFSVNLNSTPKVSLSAKEHLIPPKKHKLHHIESYVMYFVTKGKLTMKLNGKEFQMGKGEYYIFDKHSLQAPLEATDCEYFYIHFEFEAQCFDLSRADFIQKVTDRNNDFSSYSIRDTRRYNHLLTYIPRHFKIESSDQFNYLVSEFKKLALIVGRKHTVDHRLFISQGLASLFLKLEHIAFDKYLSENKAFHSRRSVTVEKITDFIENNFQRNISSKDIEEHLSLSYDYINRIFKQQKGVSIVSYRNSLRIENAKMLLITTDKSMEEIAVETGFDDLYYFSRYFKKCAGVSPTHYKKENE